MSVDPYVSLAQATSEPSAGASFLVILLIAVGLLLLIGRFSKSRPARVRQVRYVVVRRWR